jgi:uncharacterized membrane protein HdeD (DUF308 family)
MAYLKNFLGVLAVVGIFAALQILAHRDTAHFWPKLLAVLGVSAACLFVTQDREIWDAFSGAMAGFFALCAIVMFTAKERDAIWWLFLFAFAGAATLFVLLTKRKRATLVAILAIICFRLVFLIIRL